MGALDFLFEGKPPESVTTYGTTTESLPQWYSDFTQGLLNRANVVAGQPYQPYEGPRIAGFNQDQMSAFDSIRSGFGQWTPGVSNALSMAGNIGSPTSAAAPHLSMASNAAQSALSMPTGTSAAQPHMEAAARTFPGAVDEYMDPYISNVIDRASQLTGRTLEEQFLPAVDRMFGASGADPRSTEMRRTVDRGVRDLTEGLHSQSLAALSDGYRTAGQLFGQDASRAGALAQTAGSLAQGDASTRAAIGELMRNIGATEGSLGVQEGALNLDAAELMGVLSQTGQDMNLRDAAALEAIGATQQGQTQRSLDLAYEDFLRQQQHPQETVEWLSNIIRGIPTDRSVETSSTGPADVYSPSPLAQLAQLGTSAAALWKAFKDD